MQAARTLARPEGFRTTLEVTGIEARGHTLDPRSQSAAWRFGPNMVGHTVNFEVIFRSEGEDTRSRIEARLEFPRKGGTRAVLDSSAMIAVGRVKFSFVFEEFGDLQLSLSKDGEVFFEETIPLQP
jgi:tryptophan synthase beta subunit